MKDWFDEALAGSAFAGHINGIIDAHEAVSGGLDRDYLVERITKALAEYRSAVADVARL